MASTPTGILLSFLLLQGCGQGERDVVGRVRFVRSTPDDGGRWPRRYHHGVMTVSLANTFDLQRGGGMVSIAIDMTSQEGTTSAFRMSGTVREVLDQLSVRGLYDVVARIEGCDWMLTRGGAPGTIDVLRKNRRMAVLKVSAGR